DKHTQSIGAIAIDPTKPEVVWVGTGESDTRNSSSVGTGIYKTTDGGENWQLMGLEKSERISRIAIDPKNTDTVYVSVPGHLWDANEDRGLYRTTDGGKTWQKVFHVNPDTGCSDVVIDPKDSRIVYAAMWQFRRKPYFFTSGGPGGGLYKSTDAGKTWSKIQNGFPKGDLGRIAIAVAPSKSSVLYATVEANKTALYRSEDSGASWKQLSTDINVQVRPFYFSHLVVDPKDHNRVFKPGFYLTMSADGGESFASLGQSIHPDHHALWVNPQNPFHLILGTDGGIYVSYDRGLKWQFMRNLPVSQFYHVSHDMETPYNVYGGLQDNGSWMGPSQSTNGIENKDWKVVGFGDGFHVWADRTDKNIVYSEFQGGKILRYDKNTAELKEISPYAKEGQPKLRFNWNTPIELSDKNPRAIFVGAQYLFRSVDQGESWEQISPDLTTNDPQKQRQEDSGGLTIDNSTAENHCTIFAISVAPQDEKVIWVGTDDGNLQLTRDGGKTWTNLTANISNLPKNTWVSSVEAGNHQLGTAYATFDGHQTGDMKTYVYKTTDFGKTWISMATDAIKGYAHIVREDIVNPNLLFAGTEFGLFLTIDGGKQWAQFTGNLPNASVRDLSIHPRESDLIVGTHGRGIYIVDDISALRQITDQVLDSKFTWLKTRPAQIRFERYAQDFPGDDEFVGSNLDEAAFITYYLKERHLFGDLKIEIYDSAGKLISTVPGSKRRGINRAAWYMRLKPPKVAPSPQLGFGFAV
ncbi:MAG TPA: glycosyl hydrolase, partial [Acidobacteriota bacterium]